MKKIGFVLAAIGTLAVAVPSIASAETVVIKRGGHHHWDRGWARAPRCAMTVAGIAAGITTMTARW